MQNNDMQLKTISVSLFIGATTFFITEVHSQPPNETSTHKANRIDSLEVVHLNEMQVQRARDEFKVAYALVNRKQPKAKKKEAKHVESEASAAARESRKEIREEAKAQKQRAKADKQAANASKARDKSDKND